MTCGYYLYCLYGSKYSGNGDVNRSYAKQCYTNGTIIKGIYKDGKISFEINGENKGVAYDLTNKHEEELFPAFDIYTQNCGFEFIDE